MSLRVALYGEGSGDTAGARQNGIPPAPGEPLGEEHLGAAHILVRRSLTGARRLPEAAVRFEAPLRSPRGTVVRGSGLLRRDTLRQLLTWPRADTRPDLAIVLVDADGDRARKSMLEEHVADLPIPRVIAVAVQEFEAWLIADPAAMSAAMPSSTALAGDPERLAPRDAKQHLRSCAANHAAAIGKPEPDVHLAVRRAVAATADLSTLRDRCASFDRFMKELGHTG